MSEFLEILGKIEHFDLESQSLLVDIINKRYSHNRREAFIDDTLQSIENIKSGNYKIGTSDDLFDELNV